MAINPQWLAGNTLPASGFEKQPKPITQKVLDAHDAIMGIKKTRKLPPPTLRQLIILDCLDRWIKSHDMQSPSFRELAEFALCKSVRTVTEHIHSLRRKGLVVDLPREMRTLFLTNAGEKALKEWKRPKNVQHVKLA